MTDIKVMFVDTFVLRGAGAGLLVLVLRRAAGRTRAGAWEIVHSTIEPGETPVQTSRRELKEETGLEARALYNLSRTEAFYQHDTDVLAVIPVFAAFVAESAPVTIADEHDAYEWVTPAEAAQRLAWPRERRALEDVLSMVGGGSAGLLDGVLRVS
ncbi:MAG TPA: NUDIX domain-containing protein [Gemmatimonadales bacterium]|nr:NUDIX domain-containing protein [Gemmatimonadales bacterium]